MTVNINTALPRAKRRKTILILSILFCCSILQLSDCYAALAPRYQFDLVIYNQLDAQNLASEAWPLLNDDILQLQSQNATLLSALGQAPELIASKSNTATLSNDPSNNPNNNQGKPQQDVASAPKLQLAADNQYLISPHQLRRLSRRHPILLHISWIQDTATMQQGTTLNIIGGKNYDADKNQINSQQNGAINNNSNANANNNTSPTLPAPGTNITDINYISKNNYQINGQIKINLKRYFNIDFNLIFRQPTDQLKQILPSWNQHQLWGKWSFFRLMQSRRMRSRELNYIDFPLYGVLITIKPIDDDSKTANTNS